MKYVLSHKVVWFISLLVLLMLSALVSAQPSHSHKGGLYGDWQVKVDYNGRQWKSILSFSRDKEGKQIGHWISFWGLSELKDLNYEEGKLSFTRTRRNREGQFTTSKFVGTVKDGKLSGILSGDRGDYKLEGKRSKRTPRAVGSWEMKLKMGDREFKSTLIIKADKESKLTGEWQSQRGEHKITDMEYKDRKLTFKRKSKIEDREWESTFEGTVQRRTLSGVIKSERGEIRVDGKRIGASIIGNWYLEVTSERRNRKQRLKVNPDMSGLYGATAIKKVNLEGDRVSFKIDLEFGERKFEMSFEGKVEGNRLSGEMTTSRGIQKVKGTKVIRRFRGHREQQREQKSKHKDKDENEHESNGGDEQLSLKQVPEPVKATILKQSQGGKIEEIELENENGKTIYEAEIIIDGKEYELKISPDGKLLSKELDDDDDD